MADNELVEAVQRIEETIATELARAAEAHAGLAPLEHGHPQIQETVDQIVDILEGPAVPQPFGQPSIRNDGLVDKVATITIKIVAIEDSLTNGGIRIRLPVAAWIAIGVAVITGIFQVVAAVAG